MRRDRTIRMPMLSDAIVRMAVICALIALAACTRPREQPATAGTHVAPGGTLRAGVNLGNPVLAVRDSATGELRGVAIDIARELAARAGIPLRFVTYDSAARMADEARSGAWDIAFLGADPAREADITFTAPYLILEATYLVPAGSRLQVPADVDTPGVRIAAVVGVEHPKWEERPILIVEPHEGETLTPKQVRAYLEPRIIRWWMPDAILIETVPLTATGKIDKKALRAKYRLHLASSSALPDD